jgi:nanoRNase/pAp phosphatase (c-di-AMP/oligoRNAs hydrolase)
VKRLKRNEIVEKTVGPAVEFIKRIKANDKVVVVHDDDCDGVCSGAITGLLMKKLFDYSPKLLSTEWNVSLTEKVVEQILKEKVDYLIFVDTPELPRNLIAQLKKRTEILIVDHHAPEKYERVVYCNPRKYEVGIYLPVSYIVYKLFEKIIESKDAIWISAVGVLGDHGVESCRDLFEELKLVYPEMVNNMELKDDVLFDNSTVGLLTKIIDSGRVVAGKKGAEFVSKTLVKVKDYREILDGSIEETKILLKWRDVAGKEFERLKRDFKKKSKLIGKKILFYDFSSKLRIKSTLATAIGNSHGNKIIVIGQKVGKYFDVSLRKGGNVKVDLAKLVKRAIKNMPNSIGGGHPEASGARILAKYKERFLKNLA